MKVREEDTKYLSFHALWKGSWILAKFLRMPFGLLMATADFSRCYQRILGPTKSDSRGLLGWITKVWVDDNVVYSKQQHEHLDHVCLVLQRLQANGMCIKPSKCIWYTEQLPFLGQLVVAGQGVKPCFEKIKAMMETAPPTCLSQLGTFIGQSVWLHRHVEDYSRMIAPLREILKRYPAKVKVDISHIWLEEPEALNSFYAVKVALCSQPLLAFPKFDRPFIVAVDASCGEDGGFGACLAQLDEHGQEVPLAYASKALDKAEKNYGITNCEAAAMMWALRKWRHYIQGSTVIVLTDHSAVTSLRDPSKTFTNRRLANYAIELGDLDVVISHRAGRVHYTPDWLSRCVYEKDPEILKNMYSMLVGDVATVARKVGIPKQDILFDPEVQAARLQHNVRSSIIKDETDKAGNQIMSVAAFVKALDSNDRATTSKLPGEQYEATRLNEYYEMICTLGDHPSWDFTRILKSQQTDLFASGMLHYLTTGELPHGIAANLVERDDDYDDGENEGDELVNESQQNAKSRLVAESIMLMAPHFTVSSSGLLLKLTQKKGNHHQQLAKELELRQQVYIPQSDTELQGDIVNDMHMAMGHPGVIKTYQLLLDRFTWGGMYTSTVRHVKLCTTCQYHAYKPPKAPIQGHTEADHAGQKIALDVIHLPNVNGFQYALTAVDVFSRWGFLVPLKKIESEDIVDALRHRILPGGMGKPQVYIIDGGAEFKKQLRQAVAAWAGHSRVHAPHHHQSAGLIEIFNKTIKKKMSLLTHGTKATWVDIYMDAVDIYNALPHEAASDGITVAMSPAELFLGRKLEFAWEAEEHQAPQEKLKLSAYGMKLMKQREQVKELLNNCRADYLQGIEAKDKNSNNSLRLLEVGTEVTKYTKTKTKRIDGVTPT